MGELRNVCLHTLDSHDVPLILSTLTRISDIKNIIHTTAGIPTNAIRLLYKGKLVKDPQTLEGLGVRENDSFFLVANIDIQDGSLTALANMTVVNSTSRLRRSRDRRRELRVAQISEALRQTIYSLDDLSSETHRNGYQLTTRILREGQWVDALDTVDQ